MDAMKERSSDDQEALCDAAQNFHESMKKRRDDLSITNLRKQMKALRMQSYRAANESTVLLSKQIDALLSAVEQCSKIYPGSVSRIEYELLVQASEVMLQLAHGSTLVPRELVNDLKSCTAVRNHEFDYYTTHQWSLSSPFGYQCNFLPRYS
jgi:hypothetical protein